MTGCASITTGNRQTVMVTTTADAKPVADIECTATNDKGSWTVTTPGSIDLQQSAQDLRVKCETPIYEPGNESFKSGTKAMAFGNILVGGIIGAAVDVSTGAAFEYPPTLVVAMGKPTGKTPEPKKPTPVLPSLLALQRGDALEYVVTDRYTGSKRNARLVVDRNTDAELIFNGGSRVEQKVQHTAKVTSPVLGDLEVFEPPLGWGRRNMAVGALWRDRYDISDGGLGGRVEIEGSVKRFETIKVGAFSVDAAHVEYKGYAYRSNGALTLQHVVTFNAWVERSSGRVLRFDSDVRSNTGSQTGRNSREALELVRVDTVEPAKQTAAQ
jgi:hypothetical protein